MNTKLIGEISEAKILAALKEAGYNVSVPHGDNARYDLIIEDHDLYLKKVQCKTGRLKNGSIIFPACSSSIHRKNGKKRSYHGQIDFFGVFCPENQKCYLIPIESFPNTGAICLRIEYPKNNQNKKVHWAEQYEIRPSVEVETE